MKKFSEKNSGAKVNKAFQLPLWPDFHGLMSFLVLYSQQATFAKMGLEKPRFCRNFAA